MQSRFKELKNVAVAAQMDHPAFRLRTAGLYRSLADKTWLQLMCSTSKLSLSTLTVGMRAVYSCPGRLSAFMGQCHFFMLYHTERGAWRV